MPNDKDPTQMEDRVNQAVQLHMSGNLSDAKNSYLKILNSEPKHPVALHLLGVLSHQMGDSDQAIQLI